MNFSNSVLAAGLIFAVIGTVIFREGKRRKSTGLYFVGVALMLYPYFVEDDVLVWVVGVGLTIYAFKYMRD